MQRGLPWCVLYTLRVTPKAIKNGCVAGKEKEMEEKDFAAVFESAMQSDEVANASKGHPIDKDKFKAAFENMKEKAREMLKDDGELEAFLVKLEKKMAEVPVVGEGLKHIPALASLLRSYAAKEYDLAPFGTITAIAAALIYWVSPIDIIPDVIPGVGYVDDAVVVVLCWKLVESDVEAYEEWRDSKRAK